MICFNCGLICDKEQKVCGVVDKHSKGEQPALCNECFSKDFGICWNCELDGVRPAEPKKEGDK